MNMFYILVILFHIISQSIAIIPEACVTNITVYNKNESICCPIPSGFTTSCGFPTKGQCVRTELHYQHRIPPAPFYLDIRQEWPIRIFQKHCYCFRNYFGPDCSDCWYGWEGSHCHIRSEIRKRRNVMYYSSEEKKQLIDVLVKMREVPSPYIIFDEPMTQKTWRRANLHEMLVFMHYFAGRKLLTTNLTFCNSIHYWRHLVDYNHDGPGFLTWHRHFILLWERLAAKVAKEYFGIANFAFPYWDWRDKASCEVCVDDLFGSMRNDPGGLTPTGAKLSLNSPFSSWDEYCEFYSDNHCLPCKRPSGKKITRTWLSSRWPATSDVQNAIDKTGGFDMYEPIDEQKFYNPDLTQLSFQVPTMRCQQLALYLEGNCDGETEDHYLYLHNRVHNMCNGSLHWTRTSPNDPFFIPHHTQIDRIFDAWIRKHKMSSEAMPEEEWHVGHCRFCNLVGVFPPSPHADYFVASPTLGYDYDEFP